MIVNEDNSFTWAYNYFFHSNYDKYEDNSPEFQI